LAFPLSVAGAQQLFISKAIWNTIPHAIGAAISRLVEKEGSSVEATLMETFTPETCLALLGYISVVFISIFISFKENQI
jgi:hypothetical protein